MIEEDGMCVVDFEVEFVEMDGYMVEFKVGELFFVVGIFFE